RVFGRVAGNVPGRVHGAPQGIGRKIGRRGRSPALAGEDRDGHRPGAGLLDGFDRPLAARNRQPPAFGDSHGGIRGAGLFRVAQRIADQLAELGLLGGDIEEIVGSLVHAKSAGVETVIRDGYHRQSRTILCPNPWTTRPCPPRRTTFPTAGGPANPRSSATCTPCWTW